MGSAEQARDQLRRELDESSKLIEEHQHKNEKFQELIIEENKNWNLVDHEKESIIATKDEEIRLLKQ